MRRSLSAALLAGLLSAAGLCGAASSTGSVQGHVYSDTGAPLKGVKVTANLTAKQPTLLGPTITGPIEAAVLTGADGSFVLNQLAAGNYTLCAQAAQSGQLDPCHWSQTPVQVTVGAGQSLTAVNISTVKGSILTIRIGDAKGLLFTTAGPQGLTHLLVGVYTPSGQFYPALLSSKNSQGYTYTLTVPFDTNLELAISSRQVKLTDSLGAAIPLTGGTYRIRPSSIGTSQPVIQFQVAGTN